MRFVLFILISLSFSASTWAEESFVAIEKVKADCLNWVNQNHGGKKDLINNGQSRCKRFTKSGKIPTKAYSLCQRLPDGSRDSDSHQIYTFSDCIEVVKDKTFSEDSLEMISKHLPKDDVYFLLESLKQSSAVKDVPKNKDYVSRMETAESCKNWVSRNHEGKKELERVALGSCIAIAASGNFPRSAFNICMALPDGLKSSESHQVYSFNNCLRSIKNTTPNSKDLNQAIKRCERLPIAPDDVKIKFFEEILKYLSKNK